nr:hypothetical protein [Tanacetum cinerariifolium]
MSLEGNKSWESNIGDSDNTRDGGKIAGRVIITWGGGMVSYACMTSIFESSCKGKKTSMSKRYLVKLFEELGEMLLELDEEETNEDDDVDELYRDVNINLEGRDIAMTDALQTKTHVIIIAVTPEVQQQSSSVSSGFISNMLNPNPDIGIDSILNLNTESTSLIDVPTFPAAHGPIQPWINNLARKDDTRDLFNEMMDNPLDFSAFMMNQLKVDTLTLELLAGPTTELKKGSCKILVELEYFLEKVYKETTNQLDWNNPEGRVVPQAELMQLQLRRPRMEIMGTLNGLKTWFQTPRGVQHVEDLQLGVKSYQKKLNLTRPDTYKSDLHRFPTYSAYPNPRGFIYQNKDKHNRLMRIDELNKFSDGTLNDVRTALDDILKRIRMQYLPKTFWRNVDKERAGAMIQAIDKQLKNRRIMRSLEKFVGGKECGFDLKEGEVVPKLDDVSLVDGLFDGSFGGDEDEDFAIGEGVEVSSSSWVRSTKSFLSGIIDTFNLLGGIG